MNHEVAKSSMENKVEEPIRVTVAEARERLEELAHAAQRGQIVLIGDEDESGLTIFPLALVVQPQRQRRKAGSAKGLITYMADDFDAPLEDFREYMELPTDEEPVRKRESE